jgi:hypothetical protein
MRLRDQDLVLLSPAFSASRGVPGPHANTALGLVVRVAWGDQSVLEVEVSTIAAPNIQQLLLSRANLKVLCLLALDMRVLFSDPSF